MPMWAGETQGVEKIHPHGISLTLLMRARDERGRCCGESTRLPPMRPVFDSRTWSHMWPEFVVGSLLVPRGFSLYTPVFPLFKNQLF